MADPITTTTLADQVAQHMQTICPDTTPAGGWTVARDNRDGTAILVWRTGSDGPVQPGVRGTRLYHWLSSLRDAGFTAEARTDMACFSQPDEESPDGYARWLHVSGWSAPAPRAAPLPPLPPAPPSCTVPVPAGRRLVCPLSGVPVSELIFTYRPGRPVEIVLHYEAGDLDWACSEPEPPAWLAELAELHRNVTGRHGGRTEKASTT